MQDLIYGPDHLVSESIGVKRANAVGVYPLIPVEKSGAVIAEEVRNGIGGSGRGRIFQFQSFCKVF